jgi:hypothetical protein
MTEAALILGCVLLAFGPVTALFSLLVSQKAQLVIVVTTAAFFFLLAATCAAVSWWVFHLVLDFDSSKDENNGLAQVFAALISGVFFQFIARCVFCSIYHRVERVIEVSLTKSCSGAGGNGNDYSDATVAPDGDAWAQATALRLQLNDASCGVAAGVGFGGMHAVLMYGTLLASQSSTSNNVGVLYQSSCPAVPSLVVSAIFCFCFSILDVFWMLFAFFGMRRRLLFHRGHHYSPFEQRRPIGAWLGNSRAGGNTALLFSLVSHAAASLLTTSDYFKFGCSVSLPAVGGVLLVTAYIFWAGVGRIYMPPAQIVTVTNTMSRADDE